MLLWSSVEGEVREAENDTHQERLFIFCNEILRACLQSVQFPGRKGTTLFAHSELEQRKTSKRLSFTSVLSHNIIVLVTVLLLGEDTMTQSMLIKVFSGGFAYRFRGLLHCYHGKEQGSPKVQTVVEK